MKIKRLVPFRYMPGSIGLIGNAFDIAEAHYLYTGEDLDRRIAAIQFADNADAFARATQDLDIKYGYITALERDLAMLDQPVDPVAAAAIMLRHGAISQDAYEAVVIECTPVGIERDLASLDHKHKTGHLTDREYTKQRATLLQEPWMMPIANSFDPHAGIDGIDLEFEWNSFWIDYLRQKGGYRGSEHEVAEQWFTDVCRAQIASSEEATLTMREAHGPISLRSVVDPTRKDT